MFLTVLFSMVCSTSQSQEIEELSNKDKVIALLTSMETGDPTPIKYINPKKYIQHNLAVADGLEGFGKVLANAPAGGFKAKVIRAFEDGDYVVTHTLYDFFGPKVGFDIFRFENGLIVEHWDNLQPVVTKTVSGRSQTDGPIAIENPNLTETNKSIARGFLNEVLMGAAPQKITDYVSTEKYDQHNPHVADGLEGLGAAIQAMNDAGTPMVYTKNHFLLGEGNFVFLASEGQFMGKNVAFYDLIRIEDGKIVEHWDTVEEIPARSDWKNDNGKF